MAGISSAEWRSLDQVENGTPSTSTLYWDSDEDDDGGPRPSELYGKHTWKIDKYSQITEKKLQSNVFEAGSYKWFILFYPEGCDESNHLSLFLCVANADKLLTGWAHSAHFAILLKNKDPEKSFSGASLRHFWKKERQWGWSRFMELSKLEDGFIDDDTLIIDAHVQVIRERVDRPFRCLDPQYRGELIRWFRPEVEQNFHHSVEERLAKLRKLREDKSRWSSFCAFWSNLDPASRLRMSRVEMDSILKVIVKRFLIDSEVAVVVMDSMYNGLKALKGQHKGKKSSKAKAVHSHIAEEDLSVHFIRIENDSFVLAEVDDALQLLERAASEPFPPKDEKGPQDEAAAEDFNEDTIELDDKRLTELGRQTIEIFVLEQIFSKIKAAYQPANDTPSSPLCRDGDEDEDEDEDEGPKPSELYELHKWEINKYSQITKRSLRSKAFEAGGCKWYILFYPEGYDVNNNNSLYLYVVNADKLRPGWSHLVYFEIGVVNKDPKKSFYFDALHHFWKNEDSWGWITFMELSKLEDGFIEDDTLIIEAYVQVIRERADRPFPCLDPQFRWQVISWHRRDIERIFHDFVEERLAKFRKLIGDKSRWSSFCAFWSNVGPASRRRMSRVKVDSILKAIVKHFPIDNKVAVFVMDSIYNGLTALKGQHKGKRSNKTTVHSHVHFIRIEKDSFILVEVDDAVQLLERAASDPFPPEDEKVPQDRDTTERQHTELGRQAIEIFVMSQIFSKIEAAYEEDVAFKKQEAEVIREEEEKKSLRKQDDEEKSEP